MKDKFEVKILSRIGDPDHGGEVSEGTTGKNERNVDHLLKDKDAKWFRQMAGTALYLSSDRPTMQFAVSQIATGMLQPTELHLLHLKRLVRYLVKYPTEQWRFDLQDEPDSLHIYCDSN